MSVYNYIRVESDRYGLYIIDGGSRLFFCSCLSYYQDLLVQSRLVRVLPVNTWPPNSLNALIQSFISSESAS
jgi:hypothetical protein